MSWTILVWLAYLLVNPRLISGICTSSTSSSCSEEGSVRLVCLRFLGTNFEIDDNAGRLEVCRNRVWGTVSIGTSTGFWSEKNNLVACRQLGFEGALNSIPPNQLTASTQYASSLVPVHYTSVQCDGTETGIVNCSKSVASTTSHGTDAFIVCWPSDEVYTDLHANTSSSDFVVGSTRLVGDVSNGRGIVEVLTSIGWSTICPDSSWTNTQATSICQYLGYESGIAETRFSESANLSPRLVRDPICSTQVQTASFTRIDGGFCTYNAESCPSGGYAAVTCSSSSRRQSGDVRLYGLDFINNDRQQGVVEYFANGRWGVVCQPFSTTEVDESICDGFGYNRDESLLSSLTRTRTQLVESRVKPVWIGNLQCTSSDRRFSDCSLSRPLGYGTCGSSRNILVVDCGPKRSGLSGGAIAGIVVGIVIVVIGVVFLIIKKDEWLPALKRSSFGQGVGECLACKCCSNVSFNARPTTTTHRTVHTTAATVTLSQAPAPIPPAAQSSTPAAPEPEPEPVHEDAELTKPPPPSYTTAFNLPNPKDEQPPPYSAHIATPSAPPPAAFALPQNNPAYPPGANPAYPPGANPAYPPGANPAYPPEVNTPYPSNASASPYPVDSAAPYPSGGTALPYPTTSVADQVYPPPPNTATEYPPATYPQPDGP